MEEEEEEVKGTPIGKCYREKNCTGTRCSVSQVTEQVCKDLPLNCKSWKNTETEECVNF
jgi:hypothetical protein